MSFNKNTKVQFPVNKAPKEKLSAAAFSSLPCRLSPDNLCQFHDELFGWMWAQWSRSLLYYTDHTVNSPPVASVMTSVLLYKSSFLQCNSKWILGLLFISTILLSFMTLPKTGCKICCISMPHLLCHARVTTVGFDTEEIVQVT